MKTTITTRLGLLVTMLLTILPSSAYDFEVDGIYYDIVSIEDLTCAVTYGDTEYEGDIEIPVEITYNSRTLKVTEIGQFAFYKCTSLTSVTIPDSVTEIGGSAFSNCTSLTSVTIPNSVTEIGGYAFSNCTSLTSVTIPDSVTEIGRYAFSNCTSLTSVTIPDSVTEIGESAFSNCTSLTSVTIPDSVTEIEESAFSNCESLETIKLSNSLTTLNYGTFDGCKSLSAITIPGNVESLIEYDYRYQEKEYFIFGDCLNLKEITFEYGEGVLQGYYYNKSYKMERTDIGLYSDKNERLNLEKVFIDRELGNSLQLPYLKELTLGEHVTEVQIRPSYSTELETLTCYAAEPPTCPSFTNLQYINVTVKVPNEFLEAYKNAERWKNFWNLEGFDATDTAVECINADESASEIGRFDMNGQPVTTDHNGIVIIRYSDGSTRKVISK